MKKQLLLFLIMALPVLVSAQEVVVDGIRYKISRNTASVTGISYQGDIVIPSSFYYEGTEYSVTSIRNSAFQDRPGITSVIIPNSVTSIGGSAFRGCTSLTSVIIPNSVTSIGGSAFWGCTSLTSMTIPNSVTSIEQYVFYGCSGLTSVTIPASVTSINQSAFLGCTGLTSIQVESGNTVFDSRDNCNAIINTASNELIYGCKGTVIPNSVTSIGESAFRGCSSLTSVIIPNSVTSIGDCAFENCTGLISVIIPNSVTSIGFSAFYGCSSLTSLTFSNSLKSIGNNAFYGCSGLTSVTIPASVTSINQSAFFGCTGLTSIQVESGNTVFDSRDNCNAIINTASNELIYGCKGTVIPNSVTSIGESAFRGCAGLISVTIPASVTSIGNSAFSGCAGLISVTIPASVTSIDQTAFRGCSDLTSIQVESGNTVFDSRDNCNAIINTASNELIYGCKGTVIPNGVTSIGESAFYGCSSLTSMIIPASVTSIGLYAFFGCKLEKIVCRCPLAKINSVFSEATCNHAVLYVPEGKRWEAIYDGGWYLFSNIRETAMDVNDLSRDKAYTLMNAQTFNYSAYDAVNSEVKIIKDFYNLDEGVAYNSWQIIEREGKKFLYNIGAQKYAQMNSLGEWEMTNAPTPLSLKSDVDGRITVNEQASQWFFVLNEQVSVNHDATAIDPISENMGNAKSRYYTVEGKRVDFNKKGLVLVVSDDGTRKKVVMK